MRKASYILSVCVVLSAVCGHSLPQEKAEQDRDGAIAEPSVQQVIETCLNVIEHNPKDKPRCAQAMLQLALAYESAGKVTRAIPILEKVIKDYPDQDESVSSSLVKLGQWYYRTHEWDDAARCWKEMLDRFPHSAEGKQVLRGLANVCYMQGRYAASSAYYDRHCIAEPMAATKVLEHAIAAWLSAAEYGRALDAAILNWCFARAEGRRTVSETTPLLAEALKSLGWSTQRVQQYLDYGDYGVRGKDGKHGTADDLSDPAQEWVLPNEIQEWSIPAWLHMGGDVDPVTTNVQAVVCWRLATGTRRHQIRAPELLVAQAMKADGWPLKEVREYVDFQRLGTAGKDGRIDTEDDLSNPLADWMPAPDPDRDRLFGRMLGECTDDVDGLRKQARLYLLWHKPQEALRVLKKMLSQRDMDLAGTEEIIRETYAALMLLYGDATATEALMDYLLYGPAGEDSEAGSPDDPGNPLQDY